jgi:hypothetical protein
MSIIHRAVAIGQQHVSPAQVSPTTAAAASQRQVERDVRALGRSPQLTCLPWVGLCLEEEEPHAPAGTESSSGVSRELDAFLLNLMYGE